MVATNWGNYTNGNIPKGDLTPVDNFLPLFLSVNKEIGSHLLAPGTNSRLKNWQKAYYAKFGKKLNISEAYRPMVRQNITWQIFQSQGYPRAAYPGFSNHGFARAVDFGYPVDTFGTEERDWMGATAAEYGFVFDVPGEAWHASDIGDPHAVVSQSSLVVKPILPKLETTQTMLSYMITTSAASGVHANTIPQGWIFAVDLQNKTIEHVTYSKQAALGVELMPKGKYHKTDGNTPWDFAAHGFKRIGW